MSRNVNAENKKFKNSKLGLFDKRVGVWIFRFFPGVNVDSKCFI